ncbi:MAG: hypothetical protein Homavirus33_5 [Homavirus sp.]|uniref:Uncharacterized protein n=1 Tax=Homavirus sp. TaxID=2487769 RepID=A0A3G5A947_9VIRU|nr:MAG: hypothetical protein Homavirus33_5 [Homavirus sp.]
MANTGSSAIISHLKKLTKYVDIIGFEPFDNFHMKKPLIGENLTMIFDLLFSKNLTNDFAYYKMNSIYKIYSDKEIDKFDKKKAIGFKMRFRNWETIETPIIKNNVVVFILVRQDVFKWAISTYDVDCNQFKLIKGDIEKDPTIKIDIEKFKSILRICHKNLEERYGLIDMLRKKNVDVCPLYYEEFCNDKKLFFKKMFDKLQIKLTNDELTEFANKPNYFKKVHSDDLKKYVTNYDELKVEFGSKYVF